MSNDATRNVRRRLATILFAGYSRLLPGDEADSFTEISLLVSAIIKPQVLKSGGTFIRWTGESVLAEFQSVVEAVRCAVALREAASLLNQALLPGQRIALCIGINLDDIIEQEGEVFGDGVNIAARLQALAEPGSVYVSEIVRDRVAGRVGFDFEDLGPHNLKNIARAIRVFRLGGEVVGQAIPAATTPVIPAADSAGLDDRRAIAVLPFTNFSDDPEQEFFADGITEDIITMLAGWRAFPVIARGSTFNYKGKAVDIKKVGEELGVRYVVEGSVRKSGRRMRVTVQLIRTDTSHHIMAERYDRDLTDLFELQDEITRAIAGAIEPELLKFERDRIAERPQQSEDAYDLYQRGMFHHYRRSKPDNFEAQRVFRCALEIDPRYPQATAALSIAVLNAAYLAWAEDIEASYVEAFELGERAVALDARYPMAHFAIGAVCMWTRRHDRAIAAFQKTIELNPSYAAAHVLLGQMYLYCGQPHKTITLAEKGIRLSPSDPRLFQWLPALAGACYQLRRYPEAVEIGQQSWALNRNWPAGLTYVVAGLGQLGRIAEARAALADLRGRDPNLSFMQATLQRLYKDPSAIDHIRDGLRKAEFE